MSWFSRSKAPKPAIDVTMRSTIPDDIWTKCPECDAYLYTKELKRNQGVCTKCNYHFRISAHERLGLLVDRHSFEEIDPSLRPSDPLQFRDSKRYRDRSREAEKKAGVPEAILTGFARIINIPVAVAIFDFTYIAGSMGSVVGEKITRLIEKAIPLRRPVIIVSASGGARMQEGIFSLMQMAKVSAALAQLGSAGIPYISVLTDPTTGGVAASLAMLGDVHIAEPKALIGFAGPRVIEQTIKQQLPEGFQRAEFLVEHGLIDRIVQRAEMKGEIAVILKNLGFGGPAVH